MLSFWWQRQALLWQKWIESKMAILFILVDTPYIVIWFWHPKKCRSIYFRKIAFKIMNKIYGQGESNSKLIGNLIALSCIFGSNLASQAWISGEVSHGKAQNGYISCFKLHLTLKFKFNRPSKQQASQRQYPKAKNWFQVQMNQQMITSWHGNDFCPTCDLCRNLEFCLFLCY